MNLTIFGANGKVGRLVVATALDNGHHVTAAVHGDSQLPDHEHLTVATANVYDVDSVAAAVESAEAVISCLGSWGTPDKDVLTRGMEAIIPALEARDIKRIVSLTGSAVQLPGEDFSTLEALNRFALRCVAHKILDDGEEHAKLLMNSSLAWTIIRSPVMTESGNQNYQLSDTTPKPWQTVNRHAVAIALVALAETDESVRQAPFIRRQ